MYLSINIYVPFSSIHSLERLNIFQAINNLKIGLMSLCNVTFSVVFGGISSTILSNFTFIHKRTAIKFTIPSFVCLVFGFFTFVQIFILIQM